MLSRIPKAHTTGELTELLKAAATGGPQRTAAVTQSDSLGAGSDNAGAEEVNEHDRNTEQIALMAKDFLAARKDKDKAQQKKLKKQLGEYSDTHFLSIYE